MQVGDKVIVEIDGRPVKGIIVEIRGGDATVELDEPDASGVSRVHRPVNSLVGE